MPTKELRMTKATSMLTGKEGLGRSILPPVQAVTGERTAAVCLLQSPSGETWCKAKGSERRVLDLSNSLSLHSLPPLK